MRQRKKNVARDVKMYDAPQLIHNYDRETGRGPLHIADKHCEYGNGHRDVTRCGRFMYPDFRGFRRDETLANFRLCKRCGTSDEFAQAVAEREERNRQWAEKETLRREQETAEREAVWADKVRRIKDFAAFLVDVGLRVGVTNGVATIERDGYEFELTGKGPIPARDAETQTIPR